MNVRIKLTRDFLSNVSLAIVTITLKMYIFITKFVSVHRRVDIVYNNNELFTIWNCLFSERPWSKTNFVIHRHQLVGDLTVYLMVGVKNISKNVNMILNIFD